MPGGCTILWLSGGQRLVHCQRVLLLPDIPTADWGPKMLWFKSAALTRQLLRRRKLWRGRSCGQERRRLEGSCGLSEKHSVSSPAFRAKLSLSTALLHPCSSCIRSKSSCRDPHSQPGTPRTPRTTPSSLQPGRFTPSLFAANYFGSLGTVHVCNVVRSPEFVLPSWDKLEVPSSAVVTRSYDAT